MRKLTICLLLNFLKHSFCSKGSSMATYVKWMSLPCHWTRSLESCFPIPSGFVTPCSVIFGKSLSSWSLSFPYL